MKKLARARVAVGVTVLAFGLALSIVNLIPLFDALFLVVIGIILILFGNFSRNRITIDWILFSLRLDLTSLILDVGIILTGGVFFLYVYLSSTGLTNPIYTGTLIFIGLLGLCLIVLGCFYYVRAWQRRPKEIWNYWR